MESATVLPRSATWLPADDILLKNAIEEGASLEALARGAVHFSHPFSLQEVHERWHALLYNPEISAKACAHLFLNGSEKRKEIDTNHRKRKVGTLRNRYYSRLKRIRNDLFSSPDLGFLTESNLHKCTSNGGDFNEKGGVYDGIQVENTILENCIPDPFILQENDLNIFQPKISTDIAATNCVFNGGEAFHPEGSTPLVNNQIIEFPKNNSLLGLPQPDSPFSVQGSVRIDGISPFQANNNGCNDIIHHGLEANFTSTGKILLPGDELSNINIMGYSPPLPDMPINVENAQHALEFPDNDEIKIKTADKESGDRFINAASISDNDFVVLPDSHYEFSNDSLLFIDVDGKDTVDNYCCDNTMLSISTLNEKPLDHIEGKFYCALNTEDPEIPCNDDIFLLIYPDAPYASSVIISMTKSAMDPVSIEEKNSLQVLNSVKENEEFIQPSKPSLIFGSIKFLETGEVHAGGGPTIIDKLNEIIKDPAEANLDKDVEKIDSGAVDTPAILKELPLDIENGPSKTIYPESLVNPSTSDHEGPESEIDDPRFSDIEAMILDMDLGSYDDNLHFTRRVPRYQQDNSKRKIIRLEQCARASIQRAMTSRGALAVLYGRRSRHFIRKTEVVIGRSTGATVVDIDLGKEGLNNKISRYQAIVKMKDDGSFSLKNIAKIPMLVNGTEVGSRELIGLGSSCLIEIRGISFVFESNQKYVDRYLKNIRNKNQEEMAKFEWLPMEDGVIS